MLQNKRLKKMEERIMATLQDYEAKVAELSQKIDEELAQTAAVIVAVNALIAKITAGVDYQPQIDALNVLTTKLTSDNPALQAAIDAANAQP